MTREQTIKVLQVLNAFYAGGKNDPKEQVTAWHLIMSKYDFDDAMTAVLHFAENDTREIATFPAVGLIVNEIRKAEKARSNTINEIIVGVSYGRAYDQISDEAHLLISKDMYNEWLNMDAEVFSTKAGTYREFLKNKQLRLTDDRPNGM